ncbi:glucose/arabinose dehydrogenase [Litorimonas taeanensis]|uniref:Glucose/arabinose dehydrogenase n=1 Tax=Litorimonas taeanensis TaxID=568099 RepID=A0A420WF09_9PROT|nr:PQQ-dependent sugar dehydrogenase [Litorimonas taeanensis]RKQ69562.1 glucose/arabinose dehydrogenase [Litorimonas taeanensis]
MFTRILALSATLGLLSSTAMAKIGDVETVTGSDGVVLNARHVETFDKAWSMAFLPDGRALVAEKEGAIWLLNTRGKKLGKITGGPRVSERGQGGFGDIYIPSDFSKTGEVYFSYVERDAANDALSGAVVESAKLQLTATGGKLTNRQSVWVQSPKVEGNGHYGHRIGVSPDNYLFITSGERQKFTPSQNMDMNLGKVVRLNRDGTVPEDNPFYASGGVTAQIWTLGHRNPLGLDFDADGQLWVHEMGPRHGDELNKIIRSKNYGYPVVSNGDHYSGVEIPDHDTMPIYEAPAVYWVPAISPAGFSIYKASLFKDWIGDGFIGGLGSEALIRVDMDAKSGPKEAARYEWGKRIREVETGPDGAIYVLEDMEDGRLLKLTPKG